MKSEKIEKAYTVTQINKYIKAVFDEDYILQSIRIQGEISNFNCHTSGHLYFTLKDEESSVSCVMFSGDAKTNRIPVNNGVSVIVTGSISVFVKSGQYQIYVKKIEPYGKGDLYLKFEDMKSRLLQEGLFDDKYKKPLPNNPKLIAIVTSPTGAAVKDIISVARRRNKFVKLALFPVLVQGDSAAQSISEAIYDINSLKCADIIIVGRGGGSIEDLWAFNEEIVARAIFASKIPVISAVGHQTDFTIADFVADARAATPSVSAEIAVPLLLDKAEIIEYTLISINQSIARILNINTYGVAEYYKRLKGTIKTIIDNKSNCLLNVSDKLTRDAAQIIDNKQSTLAVHISLLEAVSPLSVLKRGYSLLYKDRWLVKSVNEVKEGDVITTAVIDGEIVSRVESVNTDNISQNIQSQRAPKE